MISRYTAGAAVGLLLLLVLGSCTPRSAGSMAARIREIAARTWYLSELTSPDRNESTAMRSLTLAISSDSSVSGSSGCNTFQGRILRLDAAMIAFSSLATTRRGCDSQRMQLEQAFLDALSRASTYVLFGDTLVLADSTHATLLRFVAQPGVTEAEKPAAVPGSRVRGYLRMQDGQMTLRKFGNDRDYSVTDLTGQLSSLYSGLVSQPGESVFVEVDATTDDAPSAAQSQSGRITVHTVLQMMPQGASPQLDLLQDLLFLARGNEPFWAVRVSPQAITFIEPDSADLSLPLDSVSYSDTLWSFEARDTLPSGRLLEVKIRAARCFDGMSGAFSNLSATVMLGTRILTGCATRGDVEF